MWVLFFFICLPLVQYAQIRTEYNGIYVEENCQCDSIDQRFFFHSFEDSLKITDLTCNIPAAKIYYKAKPISKNDTFLFLKSNISFEIQFFIPEQDYQAKVFVKSILEGQEREHEIPIYFGSYIVPLVNNTLNNPIIFDTSKNCSKKVNLIFPFGGTQSDLIVGNIDNEIEETYSRTYYAGLPGNVITFDSKTDYVYKGNIFGCWDSYLFYFKIK